MPRAGRLAGSTDYYHSMIRGINKEPVFQSELAGVAQYEQLSTHECIDRCARFLPIVTAARLMRIPEIFASICWHLKKGDGLTLRKATPALGARIARCIRRRKPTTLRADRRVCFHKEPSLLLGFC